MLKKILLITLAMVSFSALTGCASIVSGTKQNVTVTTGNITGANCSLENNRGQWLVYTPSTVYVGRSISDLRVHCYKKGFGTTSLKVPSKTRPLVLGNAVFGGIIGAGVDVADGAAYHYPENINVPLYRA